MKKMIALICLLGLTCTVDAATIASLTNGAVSGTGTLQVHTGVLGGILISADGTNTVTVIVRVTNESGSQIFDLQTKSPALIVGPIWCNGKTQVYYSVTGTNGAAQFYEWR